MTSLASSLTKGLIAGAVGTAAMTVSSKVEARARGRKGSSAPGDAAAKVLGVEPTGEEERARFSTLAHWTYGTGWGLARGLLGMAGLRGGAGTALHFGMVWGTGLVMLPALDVAPPPSEWEPTEIAIDGWHHLVYATVAGATYRLLDR